MQLVQLEDSEQWAILHDGQRVAIQGATAFDSREAVLSILKQHQLTVSASGEVIKESDVKAANGNKPPEEPPVVKVRKPRAKKPKPPVDVPESKPMVPKPIPQPAFKTAEEYLAETESEPEPETAPEPAPSAPEPPAEPPKRRGRPRKYATPEAALAARRERNLRYQKSEKGRKSQAAAVAKWRAAHPEKIKEYRKTELAKRKERKVGKSVTNAPDSTTVAGRESGE